MVVLFFRSDFRRIRKPFADTDKVNTPDLKSARAPPPTTPPPPVVVVVELLLGLGWLFTVEAVLVGSFESTLLLRTAYFTGQEVEEEEGDTILIKYTSVAQ